MIDFEIAEGLIHKFGEEGVDFILDGDELRVTPAGFLDSQPRLLCRLFLYGPAIVACLRLLHQQTKWMALAEEDR